MTDKAEPVVSNNDTMSNIEKEKEEENIDWKNKYLYLLADFDNYKKSVHNRILTLEVNHVRDIVNKFLVVIDDLERMSSTLTDQETLDIINIIIKKFHEQLKSYNIMKFPSLGVKADPNRHNVIKIEDTPEGIESGLILKVYREGYLFNNHILREALVGVAE